MRNPIVACVKQLYLNIITQGPDLGKNMITVFFKNRIEKSSYIFQHDGLRSNFSYQSDSFWKEVAFILIAELFSGNRKRWTRNTSRQQINFPLIRLSGKIFDIVAYDIPFRTIYRQCVTVFFLIFDKRQVLESSQLQPEGLTSCTSTDFYTCRFGFEADWTDYSIPCMRVRKNDRILRLDSQSTMEVIEYMVEKYGIKKFSGFKISNSNFTNSTIFRKCGGGYFSALAERRQLLTEVRKIRHTANR